MKQKPTEGQLELIRAVERAFNIYYRDNLTKFSGKTYADASEWLDEHHDEYAGICYELKHRTQRRSE